MKGFSIVAAILAWGATLFTFALPELHSAASTDEAYPFAFAFGGLAVTLTLVAFKKRSG